MTLQISTTCRALRDLINPDQPLLRPPTTPMGLEAPFDLYLGSSARSRAMLEKCQSPAQPQTCPCLAMEPHHLDSNPWTPKSCCALTVSLGFPDPWIEAHRVAVSGHKTTNPSQGPAFPWTLISPQHWPFTRPQALKSIPLSHSGLWGLSGVVSNLLCYNPFLDCCPCFCFASWNSSVMHPAHSPGPDFSPPGTSVMLQQGWSPPPDSLPSHGPCQPGPPGDPYPILASAHHNPHRGDNCLELGPPLVPP